MDEERLEEIIKPLENLLCDYQFELNEEMVDGSSRVASFVREDGKQIDYVLTVIHDRLAYGQGGDLARYQLAVSLFSENKPFTLFDPTHPVISDEPTHISVKTTTENKIKPALENNLGTLNS